MFDVKLNDDGEIVVTGRFDASQTERARSFFDEIDRSCRVDLAELHYISSAGLGVLVAAQQKLGVDGQKLTLVNLNENVLNVFRVSGLDRVFDIE